MWRAERHDVAEQLHYKGVSRRDGLHCGIAWARTEPAQLNNVVHASGCLPSADPHPAPPSRVHHGCAVLLAPPASHQPCLELLQLCCAPALARRPAPLLLLACCMAALPHRPRPAGRRTTQPPNLLPRPCRLPTHVRPPKPPTSQFYGHKLAQSEFIAIIVGPDATQFQRVLMTLLNSGVALLGCEHAPGRGVGHASGQAPQNRLHLCRIAIACPPSCPNLLATCRLCGGRADRHAVVRPRAHAGGRLLHALHPVPAVRSPVH